MARKKPGGQKQGTSKRGFSNRPLARLAKLRSAPASRAPDPSPLDQKPVGPPPDEEELFCQAMSGVRPIGGRSKSLPPQPRIEPAPAREEQEEAEVLQALRDLVDGEAPFCIHQTDEAIEGAVDGLDARVKDRLRRGEYSVQDHLDLHGCTREEARQKVESFLLQSIAQGKRCVLIVHGRGLRSKDRIPVLKNALASWLTRRALRKKILAFATAQAFDGGAGAVYVLLRSYRSRRS